MATTVGSSANIQVGPAKIEALIYAAASGAVVLGFTDIGYTLGNVNFEINTDVEDVMVAEEVDPVTQIITKRAAKVSFEMMELTMQNYHITQPNSTHVLGSTLLSIGRKNAALTIKHVGIRITPLNENDFDRVIYCPNCIPSGAGAQIFSLQEATRFPAEFTLVRPGPEQSEVKNGTFDSDLTDWAIGAAGWTAAGATMRANADDTATQALANLIAGVPYVVRYSIKAFTTGTVTASLGSTSGTTKSAAETGIEDIIVAGSSNTNLVMTGAATAVMDVDDITVFGADIVSIVDRTS